jgi:hypothetical protein
VAGAGQGDRMAAWLACGAGRLRYPRATVKSPHARVTPVAASLISNRWGPFASMRHSGTSVSLEEARIVRPSADSVPRSPNVRVPPTTGEPGSVIEIVTCREASYPGGIATSITRVSPVQVNVDGEKEIPPGDVGPEDVGVRVGVVTAPEAVAAAVAGGDDVALAAQPVSRNVTVRPTSRRLVESFASIALPSSLLVSGSVSPVARRGPGGRSRGRMSEPPQHTCRTRGVALCYTSPPTGPLATAPWPRGGVRSSSGHASLRQRHVAWPPD